jgi:hypothetical protein
MTEHNQLKEYAKTVLTKLGFEPSEIKEEYTVSFDGMRERLLVDVVGISANRKVAIECGNTPSDKVIKLHMYFDEVILLPYFKSRVSDQFIKSEKDMALTITRQEKEIHKLNTELEEQKKIADQLSKKVLLAESAFEKADWNRRELIGGTMLVILDALNCLPNEAKYSVFYLDTNLRRKIVDKFDKLLGCYGTGLNRILEDKTTEFVDEKKEQLNKLKKEVEQNEFT